MKVESIAEWSILPYFWSALSDNKSENQFSLFLERPFYTSFTVTVNVNLQLFFKQRISMFLAWMHIHPYRTSRGPDR